MNDREAFLKVLEENEDDIPTRLVYADWLDDHGEHEEADRQRKWPAAKDWLRKLCREEYSNGEYQDFDDDEEGYYIGVNTLIQEAKRALENDALYISCGANMDMCDTLRQDCREFWHNIAIVTGLPLPEGYAETSYFSCGC